MILAQNPNINFLLAGSGPLENDVLSYLQSNNLLSKTEFAGWISHDELPNYLNRLKLLVIPSYTEGLPNIMLEAMACGALVLTTSVGIIEDYIINEETGFILENNSPECISSRIINLLDNPDLVRISENAKTLVEERLVCSKAVEKYESILEDLL
jgi:glycosyltransferase involved in cell wall biosynthesis